LNKDLQLENIEFTHRKAAVDEIGAALALLREAALWLKEKDIDYWQNWVDPDEKYVDWIREGFKNNEFFFVHAGNELAGMYRLQYSDDIFWGKRDDRSGYLHSFTTKRTRYRGGIGRRILDDVAARLRENGFEYLRLDCGKNIGGLRGYYERLGFRNVGERTVDGDELVLYEKRICDGGVR